MYTKFLIFRVSYLDWALRLLKHAQHSIFFSFSAVVKCALVAVACYLSFLLLTTNSVYAFHRSIRTKRFGVITSTPTITTVMAPQSAEQQKLKQYKKVLVNFLKYREEQHGSGLAHFITQLDEIRPKKAAGLLKMNADILSKITPTEVCDWLKHKAYSVGAEGHPKIEVATYRSILK